MLSRLSDIATVLMAAAALLLVWRSFTSPSAVAGTPREDRTVSEWRAIADGGSWLGQEAAPVVIVEFGDYECPFCRYAESYLSSLRETYPEEVAISYRHFPITSIHPFAMRSAIMAECASLQGDFERIHKLLYERELSTLTIHSVAEQTSNRAQFVQCVEENQVRQRIEDDRAVVDELGLTGTPSFIVNGVLLGSPPDSAGMFKLVETALRER